MLDKRLLESFDDNSDNEIIKEEKENRVSLEECIEIGESFAKELNLPMDKWAKETRKDFCEDVYYACIREVIYSNEMSYDHLGYAVRGNLASWYANALRISLDAPHEWQSKTEVAIMNLFKSRYPQRKDEIKESISESTSDGLKEISEEKMDELIDLDITMTTYEGKPFWIFYDWRTLHDASEILEPGVADGEFDDSVILDYVSDYGFADEWFECIGLGEARPYLNSQYVNDYAVLVGDLYSGDYIRAYDEVAEEYIKTLVNNPKHANTIVDDKVLDRLGFKKVNDDESYEHGWYDRQDDTTKIYNKLKEEFGNDIEVVFSVSYANPFATGFDVWMKDSNNNGGGKKEENFLSEAISSKDITEWCDTPHQEETLKLINRIAKRENVSLRFGTKVGKYPQSLIIDHGYQDNAIRIYPNGACAINDKKFGDWQLGYGHINIDDYKKGITDAIKGLSSKNESLTEMAHQIHHYRGFDLDWDDDMVDPEEGTADFTIRLFKDGKEFTDDILGERELTFHGYRNAREWIDKWYKAQEDKLRKEGYVLLDTLEFLPGYEADDDFGDYLNYNDIKDVMGGWDIVDDPSSGDDFYRFVVGIVNPITGANKQKIQDNTFYVSFITPKATAFTFKGNINSTPKFIRELEGKQYINVEKAEEACRLIGEFILDRLPEDEVIILDRPTTIYRIGMSGGRYGNPYILEYYGGNKYIFRDSYNTYSVCAFMDKNKAEAFLLAYIKSHPRSYASDRGYVVSYKVKGTYELKNTPLGNCYFRVDDNRATNEDLMSKSKHTLTEGHENYDYKGFTIDLDDDQFHNIKRHGSGNVIVDIKIGDKVYATVNGYDAAEEWIDKNGQKILDELEAERKRGLEEERKQKELSKLQSLGWVKLVKPYHELFANDIIYTGLDFNIDKFIIDSEFTTVLKNNAGSCDSFYVLPYQKDGKGKIQKNTFYVCFQGEGDAEILIEGDFLEEYIKDFYGETIVKPSLIKEYCKEISDWTVDALQVYNVTEEDIQKSIEALTKRLPKSNLMVYDEEDERGDKYFTIKIGGLDIETLESIIEKVSKWYGNKFSSYRLKYIIDSTKLINLHFTGADAPIAMCYLILGDEDGNSVINGEFESDLDFFFYDFKTRGNYDKVIDYIKSNTNDFIKNGWNDFINKIERRKNNKRVDENLTEGHQVREYKGFTLDLDEDSIFLNIDEEEGDLLPTDLVIDIKLNGKTIHQEKGFRRAREWVDKNVEEVELTPVEKLKLLSDILNDDESLDIDFDDDMNHPSVDISSRWWLGSNTIGYRNGKYYFRVGESESVDEVLGLDDLTDKLMVDFLNKTGEYDFVWSEDDEFIEDAYIECNEDKLTLTYNDFDDLLGEVGQYGFMMGISQEDWDKLSKTKKIMIGDETIIYEKFIQSSPKQKLNEALYSKEEIDEFFKLCDEIGLKTFGDLARFADTNRNRIIVNKLLSEYDSSMSSDAFFETLRDYKKEHLNSDEDFEYDDPLHVVKKLKSKNESVEDDNEYNYAIVKHYYDYRKGSEKFYLKVVKIIDETDLGGIDYIVRGGAERSFASKDNVVGKFKTKEDAEQALNSYSLDEKLVSESNASGVPEEKHLVQALTTFNKNGKISKRGAWSVANGGYDLVCEIYYDNQPVAQVFTNNEVKSDFDTDRYGIDKQQLIKVIKDILFGGVEESLTESNVKKEVPNFLWTDVCSNRLDKVSQYFEKHPNLLNRRYNRFNMEHSLIMGALRNGNLEMVKLLKDLGETILDHEQKEYDDRLKELEEYPQAIRSGSLDLLNDTADVKSEDDITTDVVNEDVGEEFEASYTFPKLTDEDEFKLLSYDLCITDNSSKEDTEVSGTLHNIKRFAQEWLGYELVDDYLTINESYDDEDGVELTEDAILMPAAASMLAALGVQAVNAILKLFKRDPSKKKSKWIDYKGYVIEKTPLGSINVYDSNSYLLNTEHELYTVKLAKKFIKGLRSGEVSTYHDVVDSEPFPEFKDDREEHTTSSRVNELYEDDWEESNLYGGDLTYCPMCNHKLERDEDGDSYCPSCKEDSYSLSMKRRKMDKSSRVNENLTEDDLKDIEVGEIYDYIMSECKEKRLVPMSKVREMLNDSGLSKKEVIDYLQKFYDDEGGFEGLVAKDINSDTYVGTPRLIQQRTEEVALMNKQKKSEEHSVATITKNTEEKIAEAKSWLHDSTDDELKDVADKVTSINVQIPNKQLYKIVAKNIFGVDNTKKYVYVNKSTEDKAKWSMSATINFKKDYVDELPESIKSRLSSRNTISDIGLAIELFRMGAPLAKLKEEDIVIDEE